MKYLVLVMLLLLGGCSFLSIDIHQTAVLDKGDDTKDVYEDDDAESMTAADTVKAKLH